MNCDSPLHQEECECMECKDLVCNEVINEQGKKLKEKDLLYILLEADRKVFEFELNEQRKNLVYYRMAIRSEATNLFEYKKEEDEYIENVLFKENQNGFL